MFEGCKNYYLNTRSVYIKILPPDLDGRLAIT